MRSTCLGQAVLVLLLTAAPTSAATIITLNIADTNIYDTTLLSYTFSDDGNGGGTFTLERELDQLSDDFLAATVSGTQFTGARIILTKQSTPLDTETYRIDLAGQVAFTSYRLIDGLEPRELIGLSATTVTSTGFPATSAPEPASALLLVTGGAFALVRRARSSRASVTRPQA